MKERSTFISCQSLKFRVLDLQKSWRVHSKNPSLVFVPLRWTGPVRRCACGRAGADSGTSHRGPSRPHMAPLQAEWCVGLNRWVPLLARERQEHTWFPWRVSEHSWSICFTNTERRRTNITNEVMGTVRFTPNYTQRLRQHEAMLWREKEDISRPGWRHLKCPLKTSLHL